MIFAKMDNHLNEYNINVFEYCLHQKVIDGCEFACSDSANASSVNYRTPKQQPQYSYSYFYS